jgi:hypothetical protein
MWWRRRTTEPPGDYGSADGRHRLRDNDVVPVPGYRLYRDLVRDFTQELPVLDANSVRLTPGRSSARAYGGGYERAVPPVVVRP